METLLHIVQTINFYLSDYILVVLLVGTGVFFSLRTRFVQVRCFGEACAGFSAASPCAGAGRRAA